MHRKKARGLCPLHPHWAAGPSEVQGQSPWPSDDASPPPEWLEADGQGGFASGPVSGPRTRRYHALLLTATEPPGRRFLLVNGIEAWLERDDTPGTLPLTTERYAPDVLASACAVTAFTPDPFPSWTYRLPDNTELRCELFIAADTGLTVLRWLPPPACPYRLHVRPLLSGRDIHSLHTENPDFRFAATISAGNVSWRPYDGVPATAALTNGTYIHAPEWYRRFRYAAETARGLDDTEDLASPGEFRFALTQPATMLLRAGDALSLRPAAQAATLAAAERARRAAAPGLPGTIAASYLVDRAPGRTLIAGYPWFGDWGRDSFIALRGLLIATGRLDQARAVLLAWSALLDRGMLPNCFPDAAPGADAPLFNSVDAPLWYIVAIHDFLAAAPNDPAEPQLEAAAEAILTAYRDGTRFNIRMAPDALLAAGAPGVQLTWMDAMVDGVPITPRIGKPVEVQALWINALRIAARWNQAWSAIANQAQATFTARFITPSGALYDVIDEDHIQAATNAQLRPNQILAVGGLPFPLLAGPAARAVVDIVESTLLTPLGLRTLAPTDPAYCPHYTGSPRERDAAYHQGTAWPWLMGPFVDAWLAVRGRTTAAKTEATERFLAPLEAHRHTAGLGHVSELADADPPHTPGGCPFQAWSVGELIRIRAMLAAPTDPSPPK